MLRLLKLSDAVKAYIYSGKLAAGHTRMLVGEPNADALAEEIVARELNVREVEAMARAGSQEREATNKRPQSARFNGKDRRHAGLRKAGFRRD